MSQNIHGRDTPMYEVTCKFANGTESKWDYVSDVQDMLDIAGDDAFDGILASFSIVVREDTFFAQSTRTTGEYRSWAGTLVKPRTEAV
jgi:hypothetical protein